MYVRALLSPEPDELHADFLRCAKETMRREIRATFNCTTAEMRSLLSDDDVAKIPECSDENVALEYYWKFGDDLLSRFINDPWKFQCPG